MELLLQEGKCSSQHLLLEEYQNALMQEGVRSCLSLSSTLQKLCVMREAEVGGKLRV